jgi:signal transduction histidine kinase
MALRGLSDFAGESEADELPEILKAIDQTSRKLANEIRFQKALKTHDPEQFALEIKSVDLKDIFEEAIELVSLHPATSGKKLRKPEVFVNRTITTDPTILSRVLQNMLINAFENSDPGRAIQILGRLRPQRYNFLCLEPQGCLAENAQKNFSAQLHQQGGTGTRPRHLFDTAVR